MSIRIAHASDLHYASHTLAQVDHCFSFTVTAAIEHQAAAMIITGDATDHALEAHTPAYGALAANLRRLADHCPVLLLQGTFSHEPPGTLDVFRHLGGRYPIHVADRIEQVALTCDGKWVGSASARFDTLPSGTILLCSCVPSVNKAAVAASVGAAGAGAAVGEQLAHLMAGFAPINRRARTAGIPTMGLSHGTVYGCLTEHGVPMAGFDHEFTTGTLFAADASAFLLGHIHKHQAWLAQERVIAYAGSVARLHYGEQGDKGFLMWEVTADGAHFALVPTPARRTLEIDFTGLPEMAALQTLAAQQPLAGVWVRVRWACPEEDRHKVCRAEMTRLFAGAAGLKLEGRLIPVLRTRASGIAQAATLEAQVAAWAQTVQASVAPLLDTLHQLQSANPETLVARILQDDGAPCGTASADASVRCSAPGAHAHAAC